MVKNIDDISKEILNQMDYTEDEILYKSEIDSQIRIFIAIYSFGLLLCLGSILL